MAIAVRSGVRRLVTGRPNPFTVLARAQPSELTLVVALAVIGLVVRLVVLDPDTLHMDESLYASYGLHIAQTGDWLLLNVGFAIEKIPLFYWAEAIVISWLGDTPLSIRLVDIAASLATIGAVYVLARDLSGRVAGWSAGLAMALSPFAILFGASVFTDPFAIALGLGALALARRDHSSSAGILLGLSLGGKLFGLAYLPLALVLLLTVDAPRRRTALISLLVAFGITAGALLGFMAIRTHIYGAPWSLSTSINQNGGTGLTSPAEWGSRLAAWWSWLGYFAESNPLRLMAAIGLAGALLAVIRSRGRLRWAIAAVCAFSPAYFGLLVVARSPVYDRYLFYVLPTLCVAVGVGIGEFLRIVRWPSLRRALLLACTVLVLARSVPIVAQAEGNAFPVGARSDLAFSGYRQLCSWLQSRSSTPLVVWDHSLSWTLGYCLSGSPDYVWWYPDAVSVVPAGSLTYLALSTLDDPEATVASLRARGLTVTPVETVEVGGAPHLWVYLILPASSTLSQP
jgi:4-amino-4-deoxy-L-arabinose transferase-like glycosyltransferase